MSENLRIAILTHAIDTFENSGYLLNRMRAHWMERGMQFVIMKGADGPPPEADFAISHVDMTRTSDHYTRLFNHYPLVVNGAVIDISKTTFSDLLVRRDSGYQGPVIVKTDRNFGGMRELREKLETGRQETAVDIQRPWRKIEFLSDYQTFPSPAQVPPGVWRNPNLVVEKFCPERNEEGQYVLRVWVFLGDRSIYYQCLSDEPVIKSHNTIRRVHLDPGDIPAELHNKRAQLGFDFGKFDFAIHQGQPVLYDVNRTPGTNTRETLTATAKTNIHNLSQGLDFYIRRMQG